MVLIDDFRRLDHSIDLVVDFSLQRPIQYVFLLLPLVLLIHLLLVLEHCIPVVRLHFLHLVPSLDVLRHDFTVLLKARRQNLLIFPQVGHVELLYELFVLGLDLFLLFCLYFLLHALTERRLTLGQRTLDVLSKDELGRLVMDGILLEFVQFDLLLDQTLYLKVGWEALDCLVRMLEPLRSDRSLAYGLLAALRRFHSGTEPRARVRPVWIFLVVSLLRHLARELLNAVDLPLDFVGRVLPLVQLGLESRTVHQ